MDLELGLKDLSAMGSAIALAAVLESIEWRKQAEHEHAFPSLPDCGCHVASSLKLLLPRLPCCNRLHPGTVGGNKLTLLQAVLSQTHEKETKQSFCNHQ